MKLTVGSLFSGIEGFGLGCERAGMVTRWQVEQESFCRGVLATHFPEAERFEDVRTVGRHNLSPVDVITAGVPCQDVSVAGKRAGLAGARTGLFYEFARILQELRPRWFVFENVPGLFSSNAGRDFAEVLRVLMVECGYGVSWRVLNSQFFGVAQRRRRVFIVGRLGAPCPAEILFEPEGCGRDSAKGSETREDVAAPLTSGSGVTGNAPGRRREDDFNLVSRALCSKRSGQRFDPNEENYVVDNLQPVATLNSGGNAGGFRTEPGEHLVFEQNTQCSTPKLPSLRSNETPNYGVAYALRNDPGGTGQGHTTYAITGNMRNRSQGPANYAVASEMSVRRLTPRECERLQGFPDDWTIPAGKTGQGLDSARYRALGNAVTVQVARWIAERIVNFERRTTCS